METPQLIKKFHEFIEQYYNTELVERVSKGESFIVLDFALISKFDPDIANYLLEEPEECVKAAELSLQNFDLEGNLNKFKVRISNLPASQNIKIRNVRSKHIGKFLCIEGTVRQKSDVRPQVTSSRFECPSCGNIIPVLQLDKKFKEPTRCGCGRKGKFRLINKELVDAQGLMLEETSEQLEGGEQPKRLNIFLKDDLVSPMSDKQTNPGTPILINGILKEVPIILKGGGQSTRFDLMLEANSVEILTDDFSELIISEEEVERINEIAADPEVYEKMVKAMAPSVYGHEKIKESLLYQLLGGVKKERENAGKTRGDLHILLIGDPGAGKSMVLKRITKVAPKSRFISGKGVSGAGLTATVVKDEFLQGWSLEAGALVLANKGIVCIDELDKMSNEDRSAMHEALEGQTVTISKANIQATLRCETTVLAAANPKFGRFDPYGTIAEQIDLPVTLINRFDLIFPIKDVPDEEKDKRLVKFILKMHKDDVPEAEIDTDLLRKFVAYAKQNVNPRLTDDAIKEIEKYYLKMRNSGASEGGVKSIPISARQLEALIRISEASAKVRLSKEVTKEDAKRSINLVDFCLRQIALDESTGEIDIDRISSGISATQRNKIVVIREIINDLENKFGKAIPMDDIVKEAENKGLEESITEEVIQKLKRTGDIFEPRRGFISKI